MVLSARRLKSYVLGFSIIVQSNLPIKDVLRKVDHLGRLLKWCIELIDYDMKYRPREAIKAQATKDFIAEVPLGTEAESFLNNLV